ncbi:MAG TPA: tetratricopeptide repeat protein [Gemmataceae bacterium]|nr:tetratricopeptide repeat protein [Gemmataceae bacterium]
MSHSISRREPKVVAKPTPSPPPTSAGRRDGLLALLLAILTFVAFSPIWSCEFVNYDDYDYVTGNSHVQAGLTAASCRWAWTTTAAANWHPLTWLSLMLDAQLYGLSSRGFHATNLLLHLANTLLLFALLKSLTTAAWRSFFVAALFAVHPLHVESVAWVAERKDVLSTFFGLLALAAYAHYVRAPSAPRYALVALAMVLSQLAKPMLVTLPFVLLLLDYWPLGRCGAGEGVVGTPVSWHRLVVEKFLLLALSAASCAATAAAHGGGGAVKSLSSLPFLTRVGNALVSYVQYLRQTVLPLKLSVFYPHQGAALGMSEMIGAAVLLGALTAWAWWQRRRFPYLPVGWLWYLGTLVPVIGLVQVGDQARADRYTYVPLIGVFLLAVWGLADLARRWQCARLLASLGAVVLGYLMLTCWAQVHYWHDSVALWEHALKLDPENLIAQVNLGSALSQQGDLARAEQHFLGALRIRPEDPLAHTHLGRLALSRREWSGAAHHFREILRSTPENAEVHRQLGFALMMQGRWREAASCFRQAAALHPERVVYHHNLAYALHHLGQTVAAQSEYQKALRLDPTWPRGCLQRAWLQATDPDPLRRRGDLAVINAEKVGQALGDQNALLLDVVAAAYAEAGRYSDAVVAAEKALDRARANGQTRLESAIAKRLQLYKQGRPFRAEHPPRQP